MAADRLRINWFSPLPPARSDIAHFTMRLLPALADRADMRLWTDDPGYDRQIERLAKVVVYDPSHLSPSTLGEGDLLVYNMGNDARFHGAIREVLLRFPGVLIAHELSYHHSIEWDYISRRGDRDGYLDLVERCYGRRARRQARSYLDGGRPSLDDLSQRYPFIELFADASLAAICHTRQVQEAIEARGIPVHRLSLPFAAPAARFKRPASGPLEFVQFGYIGPSRRLSSILTALARFRKRHDFRFTIFGELWDAEAVKSEIKRCALEDKVTIAGFVPETVLDDAIARADLVFNLRYPSIGEASGSQLRIWASGTPSVVTRTGWYADLPDDTVVKIAPNREVAELDRVLDTLARDRSVYAEIGLKGRDHLAREHAPERYAEEVLGIAELIEKRRGTLAMRQLLKRADSAADKLFGHNATAIRPLLSYRRRLDEFCR
jgi:glycosyltransferase involved in cell wall biosynthesis